MLIIRQFGGLGEIIMLRYLLTNASEKVTLAIPPEYHPAVIDHPNLDRVIDCEGVKGGYDTSIYHHKRPHLHRIDAWGGQCGIDMIKYDPMITFSDDELEQAEQYNLILSPTASTLCKSIPDDDIKILMDTLNATILPLAMPLRLFMATIYKAKQVISVDTATLHLAGSFGIPTIGLFTWVCGADLCRYYPSVKVVQCGPASKTHLSYRGERPRAGNVLGGVVKWSFSTQ